MKRIVAALFALSIPAAAAGHPIPGQNYDRAITVTPTSHGIRIGYQLNVSSNIVFQTVARFVEDNPEIDVESLRGPRDFFDVFTPRMGELIADQLLVRIDGAEVPITIISDRNRSGLEHHLICSYLFETDWEPTPGESHTLEFTELNFPDNPGEIDLKLVITQGIEVTDATYPDDALKAIPPIDRTAEDVRRLRSITATVRVEADAPPPPGPEPQPEEPEEQSLWARLKAQGLPVLFDSGYGIGVLLLIAGIFGAAHALTPGHGKTMVAAYLVGERGTFMHAIILGVVVTITHTGAVIALAAILYAIYPDTVEAQVQQILGFAGGLLIGGLGLWLLLKRIAGQADHVHLFGGHDHDHGHSHSHDHDHKQEMPGGWWGLIVLGISGGIVPCWDAVALLGIAITANRLWLGVPLLVAFSVGLALVLMALGMAVVYAKRLGGAKFGESRWFRLLPIVSAALLIGIGVWLCRDSMKIEVPDGEKPTINADAEG